MLSLDKIAPLIGAALLFGAQWLFKLIGLDTTSIAEPLQQVANFLATAILIFVGNKAVRSIPRKDI